MLLLLSYAKAAAGFPDDQADMLDALLASWGTILSAAVNKLEQ